MTSAYSDDIRLVLEASDCVELFGTNAKRAEIRYRRLARAVHPDLGGSVDAMGRLNTLWDEYRARNGSMRPRCDGRKRPSEVTRNGTYVILDEGDRWVVVERSPSGSSNTRSEYVRLLPIVEGSPVCVLEPTGTKAISQPDGIHVAYECAPHPMASDGRRMTYLSSLAPHLHGGRLHPADFAWITKRAIYLTMALESTGLCFGRNSSECLAVAPDTHMLVVVSPWDLCEGKSGVRKAVMSEYLACVSPMLGDDNATHRICCFVRGVGIDSVTSASRIMMEYDELMIELFDGLHFHEMVTV